MPRWSARSALSALETLCFPAECLLCRGLLDPASDAVVCPPCRYRWRAVVRPWCERCGQPEPHFGPCRLCREWPPELECVRSAVWLDAGARRAVHALKYEGLRRVAADLAAAMARALVTPRGAAALVPIPLARRRLKRRGYNQSEALACALGARWALPVGPKWLRRVRETVSQTALTPTARLANVAGAFAAALPATARRPDVTLVLVDDVFTTGATLAAAAGALARAGARHVAAVTFGRAVIPDFS